MNTSTPTYNHHRVPPEIIRHAVWLYFRFSLSDRDVEARRCERGLVVTYEASRQGCRTYGQSYAHQLRRRRPQPGDTWLLDEVFLTSNGTRPSLWRAVDQDDNDLDILVHRAGEYRRDMTQRFAVITHTLVDHLPPGVKICSAAAQKRLSWQSTLRQSVGFRMLCT